jgi:hypothetical protein
MKNQKEPTLYRVRLLAEGYGFGNHKGDILSVKEEDRDGTIYYYDSFHRWCYLNKEDKWERLGKKHD